MWSLFLTAALLLADGKVVPPRDYAGSLEERGQEAILIFQSADEPGLAIEDLILKIRVAGKATQFAWVVPFPREPTVHQEDPKLFAELFQYVESRRASQSKLEGKSAGAKVALDEPPAVEVLSRQIVGNFDVAVVREHEEGGLNPWLEQEGFQPLRDADDVIGFYRKKRYVFACVKVSAEALAREGEVESHPLRFTFPTGGRDGIYFPMRLTGLQTEPFDVNLYVFFRFWLNDHLSQFGFEHRGFRLRYRDWDTRQCEANGGKSYSLPAQDPFLRDIAGRLPTVTALMQKLHPGQKYYLTNVQAFGLRPPDVRQWSDDLWLFPYYTNRKMIPFDARAGEIASTAWPDLKGDETDQATGSESPESFTAKLDAYARLLNWSALILGVTIMAILAALHYRKRSETSRLL